MIRSSVITLFLIRSFVITFFLIGFFVIRLIIVLIIFLIRRFIFLFIHTFAQFQIVLRQISGFYRLCLALDIDLITGQPCRQSGILAFFTDGERQLIIRNDHTCRLIVRISHDRDYLRRTQCILDQDRRIITPIDDINLLTAQFVHDRVHSRAIQPDARAYRIDIRIIGPHSDLRPASRFSCNTLDLNNSVFYFRHFCFKKSLHQFRMRTGYQDLRTLRRILYLYNIEFDPLRRLKYFAFDLLVLREHRVCLPKIDTDIPSHIPLDNSCNDILFFLKVLIVHYLAFFLTDLL